jgi:lysozyme
MKQFHRAHPVPIFICALMLLVAACNTVNYDLESIATNVSVARPQFSETDPVDFPGAGPAVYPVHGTDVSKYQGDIDWPVAKANGVSFAFIKATEGGDRLDDKFVQNYAAAKAAGVPRSAYHFYYFCTSAAEQAAWYIANVPRDPNALPPVLDMEWNHKSPSCKLRPSPEIVRQEMTIWLSKVGNHFGKRPIIYVTPDFYEENLANHFQNYEFFLRAVADHPSNIYEGRKWAFWQYSGTGNIPGINGSSDMNVFNGSPAAFKKWVAARQN